MKQLTLLMTAFFLLACTQSGNAQQKVPQRIWDTVRAKGSAYVIVDLDVPSKAIADSKSQEMRRQNSDIAAAQDRLLAELAGTNYKLTARFELVPGIALEVDLSVLPLLEKSKVVKSVTENGVNRISKPDEKRE